MRRRLQRQSERGALLAEALVALALVGLVAVGGAGLVHVAARCERDAARVDLALGAAQALVARLDVVSFARLPRFFGAAGVVGTGVLDTADGTAPADWADLVADLPDGAIRARLVALGPGGGASTFAAARALRLEISISWRENAGRRVVEIACVRY